MDLSSPLAGRGPYLCCWMRCGPNLRLSRCNVPIQSSPDVEFVKLVSSTIPEEVECLNVIDCSGESDHSHSSEYAALAHHAVVVFKELKRRMTSI
jgi:hypothetical protein